MSFSFREQDSYICVVLCEVGEGGVYKLYFMKSLPQVVLVVKQTNKTHLPMQET